MAECSKSNAEYLGYDECVRTATLGPESKRKSPEGSLRGFFYSADDIKQRHASSLLSEVSAYSEFDGLCRHYASAETAQNNQNARLFAAALLVGAAAYAASKGGGGGVDYLPRSCYSMSRSSICRVCTIGRACGNTCIEATDTCHVPAGCACNGA
jgi:hypothetical protein